MPAPPRPAARSTSRAGSGPAPGPSAAPEAGAGSLSPTERRRLRRVVRVVLRVVIAVQVFAVAYATVPAVRAFSVNVNSSILQIPIAEINGKLGSIQGVLQDIRQSNDRIEGHTDRLRELAEKHDHDYGGSAWSPDLADVTATPTGELHAELSFAQSDAAANLEKLIPGADPWENYHRDFAASANATLTTLRTSLTALNKHYEQIEDESRLRELARAAHSADSYLAMDELQIHSQLEVARQLHALRAQQALSTNLYAVAESHRIGSEARTKAKDRELNCDVLAEALGGAPGAAAKLAFCGSGLGGGLIP